MHLKQCHAVNEMRHERVVLGHQPITNITSRSLEAHTASGSLATLVPCNGIRASASHNGFPTGGIGWSPSNLVSEAASPMVFGASCTIITRSSCTKTFPICLVTCPTVILVSKKTHMMKQVPVPTKTDTVSVLGLQSLGLAGAESQNQFNAPFLLAWFWVAQHFGWTAPISCLSTEFLYRYS